jgi:hypothetical protein
MKNLQIIGALAIGGALVILSPQQAAADSVADNVYGSGGRSVTGSVYGDPLIPSLLSAPAPALHYSPLNFSDFSADRVGNDIVLASTNFSIDVSKFTVGNMKLNIYVSDLTSEFVPDMTTVNGMLKVNIPASNLRYRITKSSLPNSEGNLVKGTNGLISMDLDGSQKQVYGTLEIILDVPRLTTISELTSSDSKFKIGRQIGLISGKYNVDLNMKVEGEFKSVMPLVVIPPPIYTVPVVAPVAVPVPAQTNVPITPVPAETNTVPALPIQPPVTSPVPTSTTPSVDQNPPTNPSTTPVTVTTPVVGPTPVVDPVPNVVVPPVSTPATGNIVPITPVIPTVPAASDPVAPTTPAVIAPTVEPAPVASTPFVAPVPNTSTPVVAPVPPTSTPVVAPVTPTSIPSNVTSTPVVNTTPAPNTPTPSVVPDAPVVSNPATLLNNLAVSVDRLSLLK